MFFLWDYFCLISLLEVQHFYSVSNTKLQKLSSEGRNKGLWMNESGDVLRNLWVFRCSVVILHCRDLWILDLQFTPYWLYTFESTRLEWHSISDDAWMLRYITADCVANSSYLHTLWRAAAALMIVDYSFSTYLMPFANLIPLWHRNDCIVYCFHLII